MIAVVKVPAGSARAAPVTSPAIAIGVPGVNAVPESVRRWPEAKQIAGTVRSAAFAAAGECSSSPATTPASIRETIVRSSMTRIG